MYLLGLDIGSSSVKALVIEGQTGRCMGSAFYPKQEMTIHAPQQGFAEQAPDDWWSNIKSCLQELKNNQGVDLKEIRAIGIAYQMHGLVCTDKQLNPLRPAIIWCDSRAVDTGQAAFDAIGHEKCLAHHLNSPGNFTASKLKWVHDNEPHIYNSIHKIMLPGDFIAAKLTGEVKTTVSGLSEGILWDFKNNSISDIISRQLAVLPEMLPAVTSTFGIQGNVTPSAAKETGLKPGIPVSYRAGDQPNNAFSLNVLNPGEVAATAGTSGVVYGVSDEIKYDPLSRVNTFAHVNHQKEQMRMGVLLCLNGTGILNAWLKRNMAANMEYSEMNRQAAGIAIGSDNLQFFPFGNGAERILENRDIKAGIRNLDFNTHTQAHMFRAAQEGIVFALNYGMEIMQSTGISVNKIRAGYANMFLSPVFRETLANTTRAGIELYETDGAKGAALGAGIGVGHYESFKEAFTHLKKTETIIPDASKSAQCTDAYNSWKQSLFNLLK